MDMSINVGGDTLVLNSDGLPLDIIPVSTVNWRDAIKALWQDNVQVLHSYEDWVVRSPSVELQVPAVIMMRQWVKMGRKVKFSRRNVYIRDRFTCQYCNEVFDHEDLTLDHYVPRLNGGRTEWSNIVSACSPCNHAKSHFSKMKPTNLPRKPTYGEMVNILRTSPITIRHESWNHYLGWPDELVNIRK